MNRAPSSKRTIGTVRALNMLAWACVIVMASHPGVVRAADPSISNAARLRRSGLPLEHFEGVPGTPGKAATVTRATSTISFGRFTSRQVNVAPGGLDIVGDAANEPSIAVDPTNHNRMVIGWRQFDTIASAFREAGFGYTSNGGLSWTKGEIQSGRFRSDPVLGVDGDGRFFYNSLSNSGGLTTQIFSSVDGTSWGPEVFGYGGDKQWMTVDRDLDNLYQAWSIAGNLYEPNTFNKSIDDGVTFGAPQLVPNSPVWGTLAVAADHTLYLTGWGDGLGCDICVSRSTAAQNHDQDPPAFTSFPVDLGGFPEIGGPNPEGLLGQLWIAVDRSIGPRAGWVYVLGSVVTPADPLDVHFVRSTDRGQTWSAPVRVNDDPAGNGAFQWFGTMSVSPSGRIDAVWNDTRGSADINVSALYYSYSTDGGSTWSANEQATPTWSSTVGWPIQQKIGDYYDMASDNTGADVAYAATFNGGQDVYYLRIPFPGQVAVDPSRAGAARLLVNHPNPFATSTDIRFDAPIEGSHIRLEIFDVRGRRVARLLDRFVTGSGQSVGWDGRLEGGSPASPGVYLCRLEAGGRVETRRLLRIP